MAKVTESMREREDVRLWRKAMEAAAQICEAQALVFLSPEYSTGQPLSSLQERFACRRCAEEIREAAGLPTEKQDQS